MVKRRHVRGILNDAIDDRVAYVDASTGIPEYQEPAEAEIAAFKGLMKRYYEAKRFNWTAVDRETFRKGCLRALSWREGYLDSITGFSDKGTVLRVTQEVRAVRLALDEFGGDPMAKAIAATKSISLWDLRASEVGTRVYVETLDGYLTHTIKEDGVLLGTVTVDPDGTVKAVLADGSIANEPFEDRFEAQQWIIDRLSRNALVRSVGADDFGSGPKR